MIGDYPMSKKAKLVTQWLHELMLATRIISYFFLPTTSDLPIFKSFKGTNAYFLTVSSSWISPVARRKTVDPPPFEKG